MASLSLDTILSSMSFHARKWSPDITRRQSRDLLRFLTIRLYSEGNGDLRTARLTISQSALAGKLNITREWCNKLLAQLKEEGWIVYSSGRREGGIRTTCTYSIGNMFRRLLIILSKSHAKKTKNKHVVNKPSQVFPLLYKKSFSFIQQHKEKPLKPEVLARIPLLGRWFDRGREKERA